jgi:hypothetical protein
MFSIPRNRTLSQLKQSSGMPNMANTLSGWEVPITFVKIIQTVQEGDLVTEQVPIKFMGVWQPLRNEALELKPEGQRSWEWYWIHARSGSVELETADKILFMGKRFKVITKKDYKLNGFIEYEICRDYEEETENA